MLLLLNKSLRKNVILPIFNDSQSMEDKEKPQKLYQKLLYGTGEDLPTNIWGSKFSLFSGVLVILLSLFAAWGHYTGRINIREQLSNAGKPDSTHYHKSK
jgi:hypothetical protein